MMPVIYNWGDFVLGMAAGCGVVFLALFIICALCIVSDRIEEPPALGPPHLPR